jgi:hypothetical protein
LFIGYSLVDPDFHAVYRQIAIAMGKSHPTSLALTVSQPEPAVAKHWLGLGVRTATLAKAISPALAISQFLGVSPAVSPVPTGEQF